VLGIFSVENSHEKSFQKRPVHWLSARLSKSLDQHNRASSTKPGYEEEFVSQVPLRVTPESVTSKFPINAWSIDEARMRDASKKTSPAKRILIANEG
jgi:hypothetical protein